MTSPWRMLCYMTRNSHQACLDLFRDAMTEIPPNLQWNFTTITALQRRLRHYITASSNQHAMTTYVLVSGISKEELDIAIEPLQNNNLLCKNILLRVWWECDMGGAIIKLMPFAQHEASAGQFLTSLAIKVLQIPGHNKRPLVQFGATQFNAPAIRSIEGDGGVGCPSRVGTNSWPNLMVEAGSSQALGMLQINAQLWLEASKWIINMVIVIQIGADPGSMHFEVWELRPNPLPVPYSNIPTMTYSIDIDATGVASHNRPLNIPYGVLFGIPSLNDADIQFTTDDLSRIAQCVFTASQ